MIWGQFLESSNQSRRTSCSRQGNLKGLVKVTAAMGAKIFTFGCSMVLTAILSQLTAKPEHFSFEGQDQSY